MNVCVPSSNRENISTPGSSDDAAGPDDADDTGKLSAAPELGSLVLVAIADSAITTLVNISEDTPNAISPRERRRDMISPSQSTPGLRRAHHHSNNVSDDDHSNCYRVHCPATQPRRSDRKWSERRMPAMGADLPDSDGTETRRAM
jgi:hypothetical protein